jgi:hypothetical protein
MNTFGAAQNSFAASTVTETSRGLCQPAPRPSDCCIKLPPAIVLDPDPEIYCQPLIAAGGALPTFDSPDIETVDVWPIVPLDPILCTVRNISSDASASQTRVDVSWSPWGIGMPRTVMGTVFVDLPRAGSAGSQQQISVPLATAAKSAGFYGIFVQIYHPYDRDTSNNFGEQTVNGFTTQTGRAQNFPLPIRNPSGATQTISFEVGPPAVASWVNVAPSTLTLGPGAQGAVMVQVAVPSNVPISPAGTEISYTIDIMALIGGAYLGGISIVILVDA